MVYITDGTIDGTRLAPKGDPIPEGFIRGRFYENEPLFKVADWLKVAEESGIDFRSWGWKTKVSKLLGISVHHAKKFFTFERLGYEPFRKN